MNLFPEFSEQASGRAVLLSIKPKYAEMIFAGEKKVELRRSWPIKEDVGVMIVYASAPVQKLIGIVYIDHVEECDFERLWAISEAHGGGVTYDELKAYTSGKKSVFGVMIERARTAEVQIDPKDLFQDFVPPQSFLYLKPEEFHRVMQSMFPSEKSV